MDRSYVAYLADCVTYYAASSVHVPAEHLDALAAIAPAELVPLLLPWDGPCVEFRHGVTVVGRATI
jgi:hypothetical protein